MPIGPGTSIGSYVVEREIGRGGMGVVYLARDTRLDRAVAIKSLPDEVAADPARLDRFEREAKTLAQLNHPNVGGIYGIEEQDGTKFLVLEFVEGETLADRLDRGALPVDEAVELAVQIAAGVEAAHEAGVIHRDLKPANIKLTPAGQAKVLDFGLAKADESMSMSGSTLTQSPTVTTPAHSPTIPGAILGTAPYMSPEQARGRGVDKRTDIWSFGCLLYEMLTGAGPFHGETATDSIGAVLHKDIDLALLPVGTPTNVRRVLGRCLVRDKSRRLRDIGDARIELETIAPPEEAAVAGANTGNRLLPIAVLIAIVLGVTGVLIGRSLNTPTPGALARVSIEPPDGVRIRFSGDLAGPVAVSPDGTMLVYSGLQEDSPQRLWVHDIASGESTEIPGTDLALFPFWSPDSRSIGFFTPKSLLRYDLHSETMITVCDVDQARGGAWTPDGRIIFTPSFRDGLVIVDADGGEPSALTTLEEQHTTHRWPSMLDDGEHFLFLAAHRDPQFREVQAVYLASLRGGEPKRLVRTDAGAIVIDDWLLFMRDGTLLASRFDVGKAELVGPSHPVARDVENDLSTWHAQFSVSNTGVLAYNRREFETANRNVYGVFEGDRITAFDETGRPQTHYADGVPITTADLSNDGLNIVASVVDDDGSRDVWIYPTAWREESSTDEAFEDFVDVIMDPTPTRVTFEPGSEEYAVFSPDGSRIAYLLISSPTGDDGVYIKTTNGGNAELVKPSGDLLYLPAQWTTDGRYLLCVRADTWQFTDKADIVAIPLDGGDEIELVASPDADWLPAVSPDNRWLAYTQRRDSTNEVYVIPFAPGWPDGAPDGRWRVSIDGGGSPRWSTDGTILYYIGRPRMLMQSTVTPDEHRFIHTTPQPMFQTTYDVGASYAPFPENDIGRSFIFTTTRESADESISVILNWQRAIED